MIELSPLARPYAKAIFSAALDAGNHEGRSRKTSIFQCSLASGMCLRLFRSLLGIDPFLDLLLSFILKDFKALVMISKIVK